MSENNLIQRWIIWSTDRQRFFKGKSGTELFSWTTTPDLSRFYHNYSDVIMSCNSLMKDNRCEHCHPVELKFRYNPKTLCEVVDK